MPVLTRKPGEVIVIDLDGVTVKVMIADVNRSQAKVGIEAPRKVTILREELLSSGRNTSS